MKKSRYSDSQIINILNQAKAGTPVAELCLEQALAKRAKAVEASAIRKLELVE